MILFIECVVLCAAFTLMVYLRSRDPVKELYNYPPNIQARVKALKAYEGRIPTMKNKAAAKIGASVLFTALFAVLLRYVNGCGTFGKAFCTGFLLWTVVNLWDLLVLDVLWFCHDRRFVLQGTEDMVSDYHDYLFHCRGFLTGEGLALAVCAAAALIVTVLP